MATKFSQFTAGATTANTLVVGFDSNLNTNNKYTLSQLATGISPYISIDTIFTTNASDTSTVPTGREINLTDSISLKPGAGGFLGLEFPTPGYGFLKIYPNSSGAPYANNIAFANGSILGSLGNDTFIQVRANSNTVTLAGVKGDVPRSVTINPSTAPVGALTAALEVKGYRGTGHLTHGILVAAGTDTNSDYALTTTNKTGDELFSIAGDGVAKYSGQAYTELYDTANTTLTVDWNNGNIQELTSLTGSHTFTASNPKAGATYILTLAQTGAVTATWTGIKWPADTPPTLSGAGKTDVITLICYDETGAGAYYGASTLNFTT